MHQLTMSKAGIRIDEPAKNYYLNLQLPPALQSCLAFQPQLDSFGLLQVLV